MYNGLVFDKQKKSILCVRIRDERDLHPENIVLESKVSAHYDKTTLEAYLLNM